MRAAVLFSGGKDSCLALHKAMKQGYKTEVLLAMVPETMDSMMFHTPETALLNKQAEMLGIVLMTKKTKAREEKEELKDLKEMVSAAKRKYKFDILVIGGIASSYQSARIRKIADEIGLKIFAPLWNYTSRQLWKELLDEGFKIVMTKISCEGIPKELIGKVLTRTDIDKLERLSEKHKFRLDFEGGEAETAVLLMPEFEKEIKIEFDVESEGEYRHFLKIKKIK